MNWTDLLSAVGLMLVLEGLLPFASPDRWRNMMRQVGAAPDSTLRTIGALSIIAGLLLLYLVRS